MYVAMQGRQAYLLIDGRSEAIPQIMHLVYCIAGKVHKLGRGFGCPRFSYHRELVATLTEGDSQYDHKLEDCLAVTDTIKSTTECRLVILL